MADILKAVEQLKVDVRRLEVEAAEWKRRAGKWRAELDRLLPELEHQKHLVISEQAQRIAAESCGYCKKPTDSPRWCGNPGCGARA